MRQILEYTKMAFRNIVANKMRSLLTMLGIIIGISAVIIVLCIGNGGQAQIEEQLGDIANGSVYINVWGSDTDPAMEADAITDDDIEMIANTEGIVGVTMLSGFSGSARATRDTVAASVDAGTPQMNLVMPTTLERGSFWTESDYAAARRVCTIDSDGAKELFGSDNVVGMTFQLTMDTRTVDFTIVGITKTTSMSFGPNVTASIRMPQSTLASLVDYTAGPYWQIAMLAEDTDRSTQIANRIISALEIRHSNVGREMYHVLDTGLYMAEITSVIGLVSTIIAAIAGISLLVGGIGVMNIMLVSVTERTREIGIRKALGAKTRTILFQFLVESAALTMIGGVIGIILGVWGGYSIGSAMGISASIGVDLVIYIALFSSAIGIFFGIYPARKAAKLNPIEALRSE